MRGKQAINFVKLKRTLRTKFVNAVLVNVYNNYCLICINQYFSRYFENKAYNFFEQHWTFCVHQSFLSFSHHLTLAIARLTFQMMGPHNLIGSSRSVKILEAALGSSSSGSKAYFLFKVHNLASSGSVRPSTAIWLASCLCGHICEIKNTFWCCDHSWSEGKWKLVFFAELRNS